MAGEGIAHGNVARKGQYGGGIFIMLAKDIMFVGATIESRTITSRQLGNHRHIIANSSD
jgi:hypothetical protein